VSAEEISETEEISLTTPLTQMQSVTGTETAVLKPQKGAGDGQSQATTVTPAEMPVTGAGHGTRGLAILLSIASVLTLLIGVSLWERRENNM
jgi:hypothetical protein